MWEQDNSLKAKSTQSRPANRVVRPMTVLAVAAVAAAAAAVAEMVKDNSPAVKSTLLRLGRREETLD